MGKGRLQLLFCGNTRNETWELGLGNREREQDRKSLICCYMKYMIFCWHGW